MQRALTSGGPGCSVGRVPSALQVLCVAATPSFRIGTGFVLRELLGAGLMHADVQTVDTRGIAAYTRSPERLLYPMRRVGPKGSGQFARISWDEALERIAAGLGDVIARHGAEAIWPFVGTGSMGLIQGIYGAGRRLWNVLGTSRHVVTICTIAGGFGTGYTLGDNRVGMDPETLRFSKLIVLWGVNVLSTNPHTTAVFQRGAMRP